MRPLPYISLCCLITGAFTLAWPVAADDGGADTNGALTTESTGTNAIAPAATAGAPTQLPEIERDPFWPVDYDPTPPAPEAKVEPSKGVTPVKPAIPKLPEPEPKDWLEARKQLKFNVGSSANPDGSAQFFALMDNRLIRSGQIVKAETTLFDFFWRINTIDANGVALTPLEARRRSDDTRFKP